MVDSFGRSIPAGCRDMLIDGWVMVAGLRQDIHGWNVAVTTSSVLGFPSFRYLREKRVQLGTAVCWFIKVKIEKFLARDHNAQCAHPFQLQHPDQSTSHS